MKRTPPLRLCVAAMIAAVAAPLSAAVNFDNDVVGPPDGDYNGDNVVDAADYTVWRDGGSPDNTQAGYDLWAGNYGAVGGTTFNFEDPAIWDPQEYDPVPSVGNETAPPGPDSIWFAENNPVDVTVILNDERSGLNGTLEMGTFAFGGENGENDFNSKFTLVLKNSVTLRAEERDGTTGEPRGPGVRDLRLGRENVNPAAPLSGATTEDFPWAILKHEAGTLKYSDEVASGRMDFSRDKPNSAGAFYEISGDAVLEMSGAVRFGDRDNGGARTTPGGIFRVRGSNATVNVDDFINESRLGLWDHDNNHEPTGITRMNLGKFVTEFVLDDGGVAPINVTDELRLGRDEVLDGNTEVGYGFLRLKLSEPTTAGSGELGSGDEVVLFNFGRLTSGGALATTFGGEIGEGRFFDPDREGTGTSGTAIPHDLLADGRPVTAEYAGATYQWTINYFEGAGSAPVEELDNTVVLSGLSVIGTPGDLDGNGSLGAEDRALLETMIAAPPEIAIATAQNLFDLNADDVVDSLDLATFDAHFGGGSLSIPEPASAALVFFATAGLAAATRRR